MKSMVFNNRQINLEMIDVELRQEVAEILEGTYYDGHDKLLVVFLKDEAVVEELKPLVEAIINAHDPTQMTAQQAALAAAADAPERAKAVPGWALWDEAQAVDYIDTNVTDLASAKSVLVAMARLLVAQRDALWPGLGVE